MSKQKNKVVCKLINEKLSQIKTKTINMFEPGDKVVCISINKILNKGQIYTIKENEYDIPFIKYYLYGVEGFFWDIHFISLKEHRRNKFNQLSNNQKL